MNWRRNVGYGALGALVAPLLLVLLVVLAISALLCIVLIGVPALVGSLAGVRAWGSAERAVLARRYGVIFSGGIGEAHRGDAWITGYVFTATTARTLAWTGLRALTGSIALVSAAIGIAATILLVPALVSDGWLRAGTGQSAAGLASWWVVPAVALALAIAVSVVSLTGWLQLQAVPLLGQPASEALKAAERAQARRDERSKLAADLHDAVGHGVTVAVLQANAAERVFDHDPDFVRGALIVIQREGRIALSEIDRVMSLLNDPGAAASEGPDLTNAPDLMQVWRDAGLAVSDSLAPVGQIPPMVSRTAYRVIREAGTNVLRHAPADRVDVTVVCGDQTVTVTVTNSAAAEVRDRLPRLGTGGGYGLHGLRTRCESIGGTLHAGPIEDGTAWRVCACLPLIVST